MVLIELIAISDKLNHDFNEIIDIGDGSYYIVSDEAKIRISKRDLELAFEVFKIKYDIKP